MRGSSYHERDFAFGRTMLTLRTRIGLTQAGLAEALGISRKAVAEWEVGNSYPHTEHLQQIIALAIQYQIFPAGRVVEEVRAMWRAAHQKVLLDEAWLATLIPPTELSLGFHPVEGIPFTAAPAHRVDWNDAPAVPGFYGREREMDQLAGWIMTDRCRLVCLLGMGGIGKTVLAVQLMHRLAERFEVVIWQSLQNLPTCEALMKELLQVLAPQALTGEILSVEQRLDILREQMRQTRVLLVVDHLEAALVEGDSSGRIKPGFQALEYFLRLTAETAHQSCVLLTSREKPEVLVPMEGNQAPVRVLRLAALDAISCSELLAEKGVKGSAQERQRLIEAYNGNPLALKIVAQTIADLFNGKIAVFLEQGEVIFGGVRSLLEEQFSRLSRLEQTVLLWLAILREPATVDEVMGVLVTPVPRARVLEALNGLDRHSLIEPGQKQGSFALQSVVMEFLIDWLITQVSTEIQSGDLDYGIGQSLELALAREYVRQMQEHSIVVPI